MQITVLLRQTVDCRVPLPVDNYQEKPMAAGMVEVVNPADWYAFGQAVQIAQATPGTKVAVFAIGNGQSEESLRWCRAAGADVVERIWDPVLQDADQLGRGRVFAAAFRRYGPTVVLCGDACPDRMNSLVPGLAAAAAGMPYVPGVDKIEKIEGGNAIVIRRQAKGKRERVTVRLPACLALVPMAEVKGGEPDMPAVIKAFAEPVPCLDLTALGVAAQSVAGRGAKSIPVTVRLRKPPLTKPVTPQAGSAEQRLRQIISGSVSRKQGEVVSGSPPEVVELIVEFLRRLPVVGS